MQAPTLSTDESFTESVYMYDVDYNSTGLVFLCEQQELMKFVSIFVSASYSLVFILSLTGNTLILFVLAKCEKMANVTNIFILNLVISDVVFSLSMPFWAVYHSSQWIFGDIMCKIISWLFFVGFYSSVMFLTLMTIDRYLVILHGLSVTSTQRVRYAIVASLVVWCLSLAANIPELIFSGERSNLNNEILCEETAFMADHYHIWKQMGFYQHSVLFFFVPLIIVIFCYSRIVITIRKSNLQTKCRVVKLVFFIVMLFFLCWMPYNLLLIILFRRNTLPLPNCDSSVHYVYYICRSLAYFHCCVNPLFYTFLGSKYRKHFSYLIKLCRLRAKAVQQQDVSLNMSMASM